ncbi:DUF58 domain-containing protein [Alicyclobacillus sp. SO9]|uniref:DUF58 domain-containing protein n=1 Tax=Alicyclobacillus sp. SO9 TaxID=2665646 RepID=UPI0018E88AFE|nr:DUF58 domain-containing protein [Alicyclobacillus sp. SO9]QQE77157.1 DUF58 domain-containing protein [Alicyclobacillus sp. SO9]
MLALFGLCLVAGVWGFPYLWFAVVRNRIELRTSFTPRYVVVGDEVKLGFTFSNTSLLPCPLVELSVELPPGLSANEDGTGRFIRFRTFVGARQQMDVTVTCYATRRGLQRMQYYPVYLTVNEGFGLQSLYLQRRDESMLRIMPKMLPELAFQPEFQSITGDIERFHWMYQDETRLRGIRDYQPGDPLKYIAWTASASQGKWMTKEFSASTDVSVCLMLNAQMFEDYWMGVRQNEFDALCEMLLTVAVQLHEKRFQVRFVTNAALLRRLRSGTLGNLSAASIRAVLGEVDAIAVESFTKTLIHHAAGESVQQSFLIFTSYEDEELRTIMDEERKKGRLIKVFYGPDAKIHPTAEKRPGGSIAREVYG